jgi:hypothetical protein
MHVMIVKWKKLKFDELLDELFFGSSGKHSNAAVCAFEYLKIDTVLCWLFR